jgi:hypothetical protein
VIARSTLTCSILALQWHSQTLQETKVVVLSSQTNPASYLLTMRITYRVIWERRKPEVKQYNIVTLMGMFYDVAYLV